MGSENKNGAREPFVLPEWIDPDTWADYLEMRRTIKRPATAAAMRLSVRTLEKLRGAGNEPNAVLEQSIQRTWQGLFALPLEERMAAQNHAAAQAWQAVRTANQQDAAPPQDHRTQYAIAQLGGWAVIRDMTTRDLPFRQKDFVQAWLQAPPAPASRVVQVDFQRRAAVNG